MAWVDNGKGQWVQVTGEGETNTPKPAQPPPSASGDMRSAGIAGQDTAAALANQQAQAAGPKPPPPDSWPGWQWNGSAWTDVHDTAGHQGWITQENLRQSVERAGTPPTMSDALTSGFDPMRRSRDPRIDSGALDPYRAERDAALGDQRRVLAETLAYTPPELTPEGRSALEQRFAERATLAANSLASNARGGAGAVAAARLGVNQQMPEIAGQANSQATQAALQAFDTRVKQLSTAGQVASTIGQTATGAFGQELGAQETAAQVDLSVLGIDNQSQQIVGSMIQHLNELGLDYSKLDIGVQESIMNDLTKRYGIDEAAAAQIEAAAKANEKGPLDYLIGIAKVGTDSVAAYGKLTGGGGA